jgi:hypothetical protein
MFRRTIEKLDRIFHSDNNLRVREGRHRTSRRFSPSLTVAGLEMRLSLSGLGIGEADVSVTVTNEEIPNEEIPYEENPMPILTGTAKYPSY